MFLSRFDYFIITDNQIGNCLHFTSLWKGKVSYLLVSLISHKTENQTIGYFTT